MGGLALCQADFLVKWKRGMMLFLLHGRKPAFGTQTISYICANKMSGFTEKRGRDTAYYLGT